MAERSRDRKKRKKEQTEYFFDYSLLFVVLFLEQWKKRENRPAGIIGVICAAVSLAVFGAENMVIPAMVLVLLLLLGGRKRLCT